MAGRAGSWLVCAGGQTSGRGWCTAPRLDCAAAEVSGLLTRPLLRLPCCLTLSPLLGAAPSLCLSCTLSALAACGRLRRASTLWAPTGCGAAPTHGSALTRRSSPSSQAAAQPSKPLQDQRQRMLRWQRQQPAGAQAQTLAATGRTQQMQRGRRLMLVAVSLGIRRSPVKPS